MRHSISFERDNLRPKAAKFHGSGMMQPPRREDAKKRRYGAKTAEFRKERKGNGALPLFSS
jgi:hypothetical protein